MAGILALGQVQITKKGAMMGIITLEDLTGQIEGLVFPKVYERYSEQLNADQMVILERESFPSARTRSPSCWWIPCSRSQRSGPRDEAQPEHRRRAEEDRHGAAPRAAIRSRPSRGFRSKTFRTILAYPDAVREVERTKPCWTARRRRCSRQPVRIENANRPRRTAAGLSSPAKRRLSAALTKHSVHDSIQNTKKIQGVSGCQPCAILLPACQQAHPGNRLRNAETRDHHRRDFRGGFALWKPNTPTSCISAAPRCGKRCASWSATGWWSM